MRNFYCKKEKSLELCGKSGSPLSYKLGQFLPKFLSKEPTSRFSLKKISMARKMAGGRRKIEMKMIPSKSARQVAFSKRRLGIFKKANELCILTGCEIGIVVFSPGGKAFSFGHPSVDTMVQRSLYQSPMTAAIDQDSHGSIVPALSQEYTEMCRQLGAEKRRGKELKESAMKCQRPYWLDAPIHELNLDQVLDSKKCMEELRAKIAKRVNELSLEGSASNLASSAKFVRDIDLNVAPDAI